jgi:hypothetical protein
MGRPATSHKDRAAAAERQRQRARERRQQKAKDGFAKTEENAERTLHSLPPDYEGRAARSTVEALVFELRKHGIGQLQNSHSQNRLADLSDAQLQEVIDRLIKFSAIYPAITAELITGLEGLLP